MGRGKRQGLALGKLPPAVMERWLFGKTGAEAREIVVRPSLGLDFGVVKLPRGFLIVSSDPVTGVRERAGWYAVNVSANDVATSGNRPRYMQSVILMPENAGEKDVGTVSSDMDKTARSLGISIVGGHTELTPGLDRPVVVTTAFSVADSYVTAAGARDGDTLMITKSAGVEGTAIIGSDARFNRALDARTAAAARRFFGQLSVVREAVAAYRTGAVHAMHDCTEGGVVGAFFEMAKASGLGLEVIEGEVPVARVTRRVCSALRIDALRLISSGTLLIAVETGREREVARAAAAAGARVSAIGRFAGGKVVIRRKGGEEAVVVSPPTDEIWRLHARGKAPRLD